jgi:methylated-DNA-[protein]-cysteine S-methyltransferase
VKARAPRRRDEMDGAMTDPEGQTADPATGNDAGTATATATATTPPVATDIISAASQPGVDPCDVACEAMPALIVGDLAPPETAWLSDHTATCGYCARERHRYEHVGGALDRIFEPPPDLTPPPVALPKRRPARYTRVETDGPVGPLLVAASDEGVCEIDFAANETEAEFRKRLAGRAPQPRASEPAEDPTLARATAQLREYFAGRRDRFDLPLDLSGISPFHRAVLEATSDVPFGRLDTYRGVATRVGQPGATRAVGNALGRNPVPVVVPCHRIVRSDHSLGGYTGGTHIKQHLLALEGTRLV